jgi:hypothetical protein
MSRIRFMAVSLVACGAIALVVAATATAKTVTLHFFSKGVYERVSTASGKPVGPKSKPAVGERFSSASNDYVGNHTHHAKRATASDRVDCTITGSTRGLCDGTIAIGGSMILADNWVLKFSAKVTKIKITGGTGRYRHAHGTVIATTVGNNTDLTVKVS